MTRPSLFRSAAFATVALSLALFAAPVVYAEEISMIGPGLLSCATWSQKRNAKMTETGKVERAGEESWITGFLSGAGAYASRKNPLKNVDIQGVLDYVDDYCAAHPGDRMVEAGMAFVESH